MGWKPIHFGLAGMMLIFGSFNTLSVKWADTMKSESVDGTMKHFNHPFLQACGMFLGEMLCMVAFWISACYRRRRPEGSPYADIGAEETQPRPFSPLVFLPPALCDMTATSVQYIGLTLTYASSFQMLRGAVIIFTGILSTIFLRARLAWFKWFGMLFVIGGLVTVGLSDMLNQKPHCSPDANSTIHGPQSEGYALVLSPVSFASSSVCAQDNSSSLHNVLLGDILIFGSQVIVASQMVYEEKFITKYNVPALQAVGWEGTFGFTTLALLLVPFSFIQVGPQFGHGPRHVLEDAYDGCYQLAHNPLLALAFSGTIISIAFFNFAGISVTKELSATTRMVLDSIRTLVIWMVSIGVGWQDFYALQLLGFCILIVGMMLYNDIIILPIGRRVVATCSQQEPYGVMDEEDGGDEEERVAVRGAGVKQEEGEEDMEERS